MKPKPLNLEDPLYRYGGKVVLRFDRANWKWYRQMPDGTLSKCAGVTGVCHIIDRSLYLIPWACKMMYLRLLHTVPSRGDGPNRQVTNIRWDDFDKILQAAKNAHNDILEDATDVGLDAHKWIEDTIRNAITFHGGVVLEMNEMQPSDERSVNCGLAAFDWMKRHNVRWLGTERVVYSMKYHYCGTCDGKALVDSCDNPMCCPRLFMDQKSIIDWKSSNYLNLTYLYQTAAYQNAWTEETGEEFEARWILRLGKEDGKFEAWYETNFEQDFRGYLACLALSQIHKAVEKRMADQKKLRTFRKREVKKQEKERTKFEKKQKKLASAQQKALALETP